MNRPRPRGATVADELHVAAARSPYRRTLTLWAKILDRVVDFESLLDTYRASPQLSFLTIDTTGACDLTCPGMCYYNPDIDTRRPSVSLGHLKTAITDAQRALGLKTLVFSGKEPLVNAKRFFEIAEFASGLRSRHFSIGLITNGRLLARQWSRLDALVNAGGLSFLDVSIDSGIAAEHDRIRGAAGTYAMAMAALQRCVEHWPNVRVGTASVLRHDNARGLIELIQTASAFNQNFFFAPIQPPPFTETRAVAWPRFYAFLKSLFGLLRSSAPLGLCEITVALPGVYVEDAADAGLFRWCDISEDATGQCYATVEIGNHRVIFLMQVLSETAQAIARISADGSYLPNTHYLQSPEPHRYAAGNLDEASLPTLYARALAQGSALHRLLRSRHGHLCSDRSCWQSCFGGLANADTELVAGTDLRRQPRLCLKPPRVATGAKDGMTCEQGA